VHWSVDIAHNIRVTLNPEKRVWVFVFVVSECLGV